MNKKKILIMGDYFYPDVASTGQLLTELCLELQKQFDVSVVTSVPSFKSNEYSKEINHETLENINLYRVKTKPFDKKNKISRVIHIIEHFLLSRKAIRKLEKQHIVFTISQPPILGGLLGLYAKKVHKAKFIYNIQDFNPEQVEAVGYSKSKILINTLRKIDTNTCKKADKILIVGNDMEETLERRGIEINNKVIAINNWIDEEKVFPLHNEKVVEFKNKYELNNKLVFMYSGNIGLYYDLENIIKVMGKFKHRDDVRFVFVGDGAKKSELEEYVLQNKISNIIFAPFQNKEDIIYSLNAADIHLVTNQKGIKGVSVPSKIYGVMAVGKYILGVLEEGSEAFNLIEKSGCGIVIEPTEYEQLYSAINRIIETARETISNRGMKGRAYLEENLTKEIAIDKYIQMFHNV